MMKKTVGRDLDPHQLARHAKLDAAQPANGAFLRRCSGKRAEIVLADEMRGTGPHRADVERLGYAVGVSHEQRAAVRPVENRVDVAAFARVEPRRETVGNNRRLANRTIRRQQRSEGNGKPVEWKSSRGRTGDDLPGCVHAGVGSPGARYLDGFAEEPRERELQGAGDRARLRLPLETGEVGSVVFDG